MGRWYLAGILVIGGIFAYDHRTDLISFTSPLQTASIPKSAPAQKQIEQASRREVQAKPALALPTPGTRPSEQVPVPPVAIGTASLTASEPRTGAYYFCTQTLENCIVDGGTFWYGRQKVDVADIRTPRIKQAKCDNERKLGSQARRRLWELLNADGVRVSMQGSDAVILSSAGRSAGDILMSEGLAQPRSAANPGWCAAS